MLLLPPTLGRRENRLTGHKLNPRGLFNVALQGAIESNVTEYTEYSWEKTKGLPESV